MRRSFKKSKLYLQKAKRVMPKGVTSNFRYLGDDTTLTIKRGEGAYVWDLDNNRYVDFRLGFGPVILGHSHPRINKAVSEAMEFGTTYAANNELELVLAEKIVKHCPAVEKVRFANSGTEATMHAIRAARAFTGKEDIVKFEGMFHGFHDYLLYSTYSRVDRMGPRRNPEPRRSSLGIPDRIKELVGTIPFNDLDVMQRQLEYWSEEIAAVIVEPIMGNCAGIVPRSGLLEKLRELCTRLNIVLIFDEVKTGFRLGLGGGQGHFGVIPDLACYAKAMGNGFPVAAFGGKRAIMDNIEFGKVAHGGTYAGNRLAMAAAIETIKMMETVGVHDHLYKIGKMMMDGIAEIFKGHDLPVQVLGLPPMFGFVFNSEEDVVDYRSWSRSDSFLYSAIADKMLHRGIWYESDSRETLFISFAHQKRDVTRFLETLDRVIPSAMVEAERMREEEKVETTVM